MKTTIYFIRHAHSPFVFGGERERPLSDQGIAEAKRLRPVLSQIRFDHVFSSPYKRAIQTIEYALPHASISIHESLKERPIKGNYKLATDERLIALERSFKDIDFCLEGGETVREAQVRALPVIFNMIAQKDWSNVAVGTHGNIMTSIMNYFDPVAFGYRYWVHTSKPDIIKLAFRGYHLDAVERLHHT
ncbi:histidine phosphatase family protein [Geomicrobium sp. JSM 1781026]|uniref:histidine phosphatase family protein n=1 Tax=Geomicrobium sp. JSM 1781026 TaxID=3344580 RepID=UPI0035C22EBB